MPKKPKEPDLLDLLAEQEDDVPNCPHVFRVGPRSDGYGWAFETDPNSPHYEEWVHSRPDCRLPTHPTRYQKARR